MCVIAFSPRGMDIPSPQQIEQMWNSNPDGAGYAFTDKRGRVVYRKGFMKLNDLLKELEAPERFKHVNFAIHFRIGTSGKNDAKTCHPFPVSNNFADLRQTEGVEDAVLFHNGVLSDGGIVDPLASDTQDFVVAMSPLLRKPSKSKSRDFFIEELVKGSRLLILYKGNKFKMFGEWKKDGDIWVSNLHYKAPYTWYGSQYYGDGSWTLDNEDEEMKLLYGERPARNYGDIKAHNLNPLNTDDARALWARVVESDYEYLTPDEMQMLKDSAEYRTGETGGTMERAGFTIGYDIYQGSNLVWVEDIPEDTPTTSPEPLYATETMRGN